MCNDESIKNEFYLNDNIRIDGLISDFKLYVDNNLILEHCANFSFIANKLFATKSDSNIYIFRTRVVIIDGKPNLEKPAVISIKSPKDTKKIKIDGNIYIIDYDSQITFCDYKKS